MTNQQIAQIRESIAKAMNADAQEQQSDGDGKCTTILDTAANISFINLNNNIPTRLTRGHNIQTPNGMFRSNTAATITLQKGNRATKAEALVHDKLPRNLLSTTPIVQDIWPIIMDNNGAAIVNDDVYKKVK